MAEQKANLTNNANQEVKQTYGLTYIKNLFVGILDLKQGVDKKAVIQEIKDKKSMAGANAWMLMCSVIIASIGLDRNSDAVIIGAMLISPLMSPILGIGLGIGINDKEVLKKSFIHFSAAILIAVISSTIYFALTPFGDITPAIFSRTEPNTLDVFVAIFGGLAGIISIARKDISTTLPGVAIATALMPPLCVTGYGIAKGDMNFALSAFYLFVLNTSFISIATYIIVRYLRFPYRRYLNKRERFRNRFFVLLFGLLVIIPSFYILGQLLQKNNTQNIIKEFITNDLGDDKLNYDTHKIVETDSTSTLVLQFYGSSVTPKDEELYEQKLIERGLENWDVFIINSSEVPIDKVESIEKSVQEIREIAQQEREAETKRIQLLQTKTQDSTFTVQLNKELKSLYPDVESVLAGKLLHPTDSTFQRPYTVIVDYKKGRKLSKEDKAQMENFLQQRISEKPIRILID